MTHLPLPWWLKTSSAPTTTSCSGGSVPTTTSNSSRTEEAASNNCCGLSKLVRRLKKRTKTLHYPSSRHPSIQCCYDPLSYSLNFDTTDFLDEDYYKYYAFSSRFVATSTTDCQRSVLVEPSH